MTALAAEAAAAARRLARRRTSGGAGALAAGLLAYAALVRPVASARDAVSAATAVAAFTLLVLAAGVIADDRQRCRLAIAATHPAPPRVWVVGRWLAVSGAAGAVLLAGAAVLLTVAGGWGRPGPVALALAASCAHVAAFAALAVALSCRTGATGQVLGLIALLVAGAVPPDVVAQALPGARAGAGAAVSAAWALLPTSWAVGRLHAWALGGGTPAPWLGVAVMLQSAAWLAAGAIALGRAELAPRGG